MSKYLGQVGKTMQNNVGGLCLHLHPNRLTNTITSTWFSVGQGA
jgi:hypothetical protein